MPSKERVLRDAYELRKHWHYIGDTAAIREISRRLAERARQEDVITYSELVRGIVFHLPNVSSGRPFELGIPEWEDLHRAIIGECLAEVSLITFEAGEFLASAVAVSKATGEPSDGFRSLLEKLGFVSSRSDPRSLAVWVEQLRKSYAWFQANPKWPDA